MKKKWIAVVGSGILVASLAFGGVGFAKSEPNEVRQGTVQVEANLPSLAKISLEQAIKKSVHTIPGQPLKAELTNENGFLVYNVEVVTNDKAVVQVKVDAGSGKVVGTERDTVDHDDDCLDRDHEEGHGDREYRD